MIPKKNGYNNNKCHDKQDMFKKLISQLIGKDMAKLFKKEIVIKNLPSLAPSKVKLIPED